MYLLESELSFSCPDTSCVWLPGYCVCEGIPYRDPLRFLVFFERLLGVPHFPDEIDIFGDV